MPRWKNKQIGAVYYLRDLANLQAEFGLKVRELSDFASTSERTINTLRSGGATTADSAQKVWKVLNEFAARRLLTRLPSRFGPQRSIWQFKNAKRMEEHIGHHLEEVLAQPFGPLATASLIEAKNGHLMTDGLCGLLISGLRVHGASDLAISKCISMVDQNACVFAIVDERRDFHALVSNEHRLLAEFLGQSPYPPLAQLLGCRPSTS